MRSIGCKVVQVFSSRNNPKNAAERDAGTKTNQDQRRTSEIDLAGLRGKGTFVQYILEEEKTSHKTLCTEFTYLSNDMGQAAACPDRRSRFLALGFSRPVIGREQTRAALE